MLIGLHAVGPEGQEVAGRERLADDGDVGAGHVRELGAPVGPREAQLGPGVDRHRRPPVRPHREREVLTDRCARVVPFRVDDVHVARPVAEQRVLAHRRRSRRGSTGRANDRGCGARARSPNTSTNVACRSTLVVSASTVRGATPGQAIEQRRVAEIARTRGCRACRTHRARRGSGRDRCRGRTRCRPTTPGRRARRGCARASGRSSPASTGSWRGSAGPRSVATGPSRSSRSSTAAR